MRAINSDKLGEKGKKRFGEICADANLECNASDYDRTGWDFIAEFPFIPVGASLEERKKPVSCHVQLKTIWEENELVKLRLSSAEHLAKELKPAFIYVFQVNRNLEFTGAYLIHLMDDPLAKVLKRLRKEDVAQNTKPNKKTVSFSVREGVAVPPMGEALRIALLAACETDMSAYIARKASQLETLGFQGRPYEFKVSLSAENFEEIVDTFLGLRKEITATDIETSSTRFGIRKQLGQFSDRQGKITIQPSPADSCTITVRSGPLSPPAVFSAEVYFPAIPNLASDQFKVLLKSELFQVVFSRSSWTISSAPPFAPQTLSDWGNYWLFTSALASGTGTIQIVAKKAPINSTLNITAKIPDSDPGQCRQLVQLCEKAVALCKLAGAIHEPKIPMEELIDRAKQIEAAFALTNSNGGVAPAAFSSEIATVISYPFAGRMLYLDYLPLGEITLGYYGVGYVNATIVGDQVEWKTDNVILEGCVQLHHFPEDFERLIKSVSNEQGCELIWHRHYARSAARPREPGTP